MLESILLTIQCLCLIAMIRNNLVHRFRSRMIDVIFSDYSRYDAFGEYLNNPSYNEMLFDVTRWTFRQFYPELYALEKETETK